MGQKTAYFEGLIILPLLVLTGFSVAVIGSINPDLLRQQLIFFLLGWLTFFLLTYLDTSVVRSLAWLFYILSLGLLLATFFGPVIRGATRWIELLGLRFQPSELVKPAILLAQAEYLATRSVRSLKNIAVFLIIFAAPIAITFRQPDLGNSIVFAVTTLAMLFVAGTPYSYFVGLGVLLSFFLPSIWAMLRDYQRLRILSFINPQVDTAGASYNAIQAMIAIGSGQLFGRGLGRGPQSQLRFLPENHTDFIFASLSEELGFLAASLVIVSYFILLFALLTLVKKIRNQFVRLFTIGAFIQLFLHVFINVGMNLGLLPITGITLPLISYGGSSIFSIFILLGLVSSLSRRQIGKETIAIG